MNKLDLFARLHDEISALAEQVQQDEIPLDVIPVPKDHVAEMLQLAQAMTDLPAGKGIEFVPPNPDVVEMTKTLLRQNEAILRMNDRLLSALSTLTFKVRSEAIYGSKAEP